MEINSVPIVKTQNIPGGKSTKAPEGGDAFSQLLAQITGITDGEEMDMSSDLIDLVEPMPELIEEEEDSLLFNPMNIPWMLMNTSQTIDANQIIDSDQLVVGGEGELVESVDIPLMGQDLISNIGTLEVANEIQPLIAEGDLEVNNANVFALELENEILLASDSDKSDIKKVNLSEFPMENIHKDSTKSESTVARPESISIDEEIGPKEEISFKEVDVKETKKNEVDLTGDHIQGFRLEKTSTNEIKQEPIVQGNIDFDENIQRVNDTIIELIDVKSEGENSSMKVKLYPEELGSVDVTLEMEEGKLIARILVENEQVRELFNNHISQLNDKLAKQDISIEKVHVDLNFDSNNQPGSSNNQSKKKNPFASSNRTISTSGIRESITSEEQRHISGASGLNILA